MASDEENMNSEEVSVIIRNYLEIRIKKSNPILLIKNSIGRE